MGILNTVNAVLSAPGTKREIRAAALTQHTLPVHDGKTAASSSVTDNDESFDNSGYYVTPKQRRLDRWLDKVVAWSGSEPVFLFILAALLAWAFAGIKLHTDENWQVAISDVQAIVSYIFDSLLMRQQLNAHEEALVAVAQLRSRATSHRRMLGLLLEQQPVKRHEGEQTKTQPEPPFQLSLPEESRFGRFVTRASVLLGHIGFICVYWISIILWLGFGPSNGWSNEWQLYINSATSALMVFVFSFLANIRERHSEHARVCLEATFRVDSHLERKLRSITGDKLPNIEVIIEPPKVNWLQRAIYYYSDLVGTLVGIAILFVVITVWLAIGPLLHFDSNWWLLIGTYAGLIGLNDGFVLRNVQAHLKDFETLQYEQLNEEGRDIFFWIQVPFIKQESTKPSLSSKVSLTIGRVCAHEMTVLAGVLLIFALIAGSSALRWDVTGRL